MARLKRSPIVQPARPVVAGARQRAQRVLSALSHRRRGGGVSDATLEYLTGLEPPTVLVPVYNALEDVRRCLDALRRNTTRPAHVLVLDDASTDPAVAAYLRQVEASTDVRVLSNAENLGFTATVNRGIAESSGDVVLLNSDTQVGPRWLEQLSLAAYSDARTATATAISDNAGAFSVPRMPGPNPRPANATADDVARMVARSSARRYPRTPTGNGFCMYVKRSALETQGPFDADGFPQGYGEENDWCMGAMDAGWNHVVDDATLVFHRNAASFGSRKDDLVRRGRAEVDRRHPRYTQLIRGFVDSPDMAAAREAVRTGYAAIERGSGRAASRVLFVVHHGRGGTPQTNLDLMRALRGCYQRYLLTCDADVLRLSVLRGDELVEIESYRFGRPLAFGEVERRDYRDVVSALLLRHAIEVVHVRHLIKHTLDLPRVAQALGIPVVLSFHDYYFSCPTVHLLDHRDRFCGGRCTPGQGACRVPPWVSGSPHLKHAWVYVWRRHVREMFSAIDAFVTTTDAARQVYLRSFPELAERRFEVIEHGRDLQVRPPLADAPEPGRTVRILVPGNTDVHKGSRFIRELKSHDRDGRLEFHFLGDVIPEVRDLGVVHGEYERDEFAERVRRIAPSAIGLFSIWAETYSHTLTEAWECGVPVVATDLGAFAERISRRGGGWLVDPTDSAVAYAQILRVVDDPAAYARVAAGANVRGLRSTADMGADYDALYRSVRIGRRAIHPTAVARPAPRPLRVDAFVLGKPGARPASVYVRTLQRLWHPSLAPDVLPRVGELDRFLDPDSAWNADIALVQRTAIPPPLIDDFIAAATRRRTPIVVDLDDNLLDLPADGGHDLEYGPQIPGLRRLLDAAALVTVSTPALAAALDHVAKVVVVPNLLDELLWFDNAGSAPRRRGRGRLEILYAGTKTHAADLALLRPALERARTEHGIGARLWVIGGEPEGPGQGWYRRLRIPGGVSAYPRFVRWLRGQRHRFDVAVAPLVDTPFSRYKSDLKYLEYAALGLPGIYSAVGPYASSVRSGETGLLTDNDPAAWAQQLRRLDRDAPLRAQLATNARSEVLTRRVLSAGADDYLNVLDSVLA